MANEHINCLSNVLLLWSQLHIPTCRNLTPMPRLLQPRFQICHPRSWSIRHDVNILQSFARFRLSNLFYPFDDLLY